MDHGGGALVHIKGEDPLELPPGFRFHPTDEELITHYLAKKVMDQSFTARAIGEVDLNKCEPWDLPWRAKMGGKEWYFFVVKDRKYPTGMRTNRATESGYWKATGKDKEIFRGKSLVGMKKTLVFYRGRAPKGEKSNWVMHEYRLDGKFSAYNLPKTAKNEWVICRVFHKSSGGGKKIVGMVRVGSTIGDHELVVGNSLLPPLMDVAFTSKKYNNRGSSASSDQAHVTCFSNAMEGHKAHDDLLAESFNPPFLPSSANPQDIQPPLIYSRMSLPGSLYASQGGVGAMNSNNNYGGSLVQLLQSSCGYNGGSMRQIRCEGEREMVSISQETGLTCSDHINPEISSNNEMHGRHSISFETAKQDPSTSAGPQELGECIWNY